MDMLLPFLIAGKLDDLNPDPQDFLPKQLFDMMSRNVGDRYPIAYSRPWGDLLREGKGGSSTVKADKDKFRVDLDMEHFAPEEINVKVVDRFVIVEGKHEEKQDEHGWISRQFSRKYMIPKQCDIDQVMSKFSSDGVLSIVAPRKQDQVERKINIERIDKPFRDILGAEIQSEEQNME
ncbi:alpha-crystallin A chain-like [Colletes gigas]|uniref:alpha-crystallin A chain-like n=1 Tax=Colletes gigas TaxID=935657 RepID=UPI001C9B1609|nr:alpha-crystallin A chain-like [Colletes gigas]